MFIRKINLIYLNLCCRNNVRHGKRQRKPTYKIKASVTSVAIAGQKKKTEPKRCIIPKISKYVSDDDCNNSSDPKKVVETKTAFIDLNRKQKLIVMMHWFGLSSKIIGNIVLSRDLKLKTSHLPDELTESFCNLEDRDANLLKTIMTDDCFVAFQNKLKIKKGMQWTCSICKIIDSKKVNAIICECCLKWYHLECTGVTAVPNGDYFCKNSNCKSAEEIYN